MSSRGTRCAAALLTLVSLAACGSDAAPASPPTAPDAAPGPSQSIGTTVVQLSRAFARGPLHVDQVRALLGPDASSRKSGDYWHLSSPQRAIVVVLPAAPVPPSDSVEITLGLESGLVLRDLAAELGTWQAVHSSKTSSVAFRIACDCPLPAVAYVSLLTPSPEPGSAVQRVLLRRELYRGGRSRGTLLVSISRL